MLDEQPVETTLYSLDEAAPPQLQRRVSERHLTLLRVGALMVGGRRELCLIRNVSAGGMMIRPYSDIAIGERLTVELKHGETVSGSVRWIEGENVGVTFDEAIDVIGLISASATGPRPRMPRVEVQATAWIREDGTVHRVKTLDVSQGGMKVDCASGLTVGAEVVVTLTGLSPIPGVVRWHHDGAYGINFNRILELSRLVDWIRQQQDQRQLRAS